MQGFGLDRKDRKRSWTWPLRDRMPVMIFQWASVYGIMLCDRVHTWLWSKTFWVTSPSRTLGGFVRCKNLYWRSDRKPSRTNWPSEKPTSTFFHGKNGRSSKRANCCRKTVISDMSTIESTFTVETWWYLNQNNLPRGYTWLKTRN